MAKDTTKAKTAADDKPEDHKVVPGKIQPRAVTREEAQRHLSSIRELVQNLRNRGDQDNNKVLDNITGHLDAIDPQEEAA